MGEREIPMMTFLSIVVLLACLLVDPFQKST